MMIEFIEYFCALLIGIVLGLTGGGGSILTVPVLVYILNFNPIIASSYSLFIVGITSLFGTLINFKKGNVVLKTGLLFAIPSLISVYITRKYISVIILRLSVPVGSHSIFHDIYENKNYITKNSNLQNNLLGHYIYDHKFNVYGCNYNTIDGSPNVNLISIFDIGDAFWNAYMSMNNQSRFFKTYNIANNNVYTILQLIKGLSFYNQKNKITTDLRFYLSNNLSHKGINRIYSIVAAQSDLKWCPYRNIFEDISEIIERVQYKIRINSILESDNENILIILNDEYQS